MAARSQHEQIRRLFIRLGMDASIATHSASKVVDALTQYIGTRPRNGRVTAGEVIREVLESVTMALDTQESTRTNKGRVVEPMKAPAKEDQLAARMR
jgi:hypothetical protein